MCNTVSTVAIQEFGDGRDITTVLTLTDFIVGELAGAGAALGLGNIVYAIIILAVGFWGAKLAARLLKGLLERRDLDQALTSFVGNLVTARLVASQLYGVSPVDPLTLAGIITLLLVSVLVACWIPARRATRLDPTEVLRRA